MPVTFKSPPLSAIYWYPVNFKTIGEQFLTSYKPILFNNGVRFNLHDCLYNANDTAFNRRTGLFLTNFKNNTDVFTPNNSPSVTTKLSHIKSPISTLALSGANIIAPTYDAGSGNTVLQITTRTVDILETDNLVFEFLPNNKVTVANQDKTLLTVTNYTQNGLSFRNKIIPPSTRQQFDYLLGPNSIILFAADTNYSQIVKRHNGYYGISPSNLDDKAAIPEECIFRLVSYSQPLYYKDDIQNSYLTRYFVNPLTSKKDLDVTQEALSGLYGQNYLGMYPYEYPVIDNNSVTYDLQIHPLKNYQTPEYEYSYGTEYVEGQKGIRRVYDKIFTGTNQEKGLDNVYLGFQSNTQVIVFEPDVFNPFYFPPTTRRMPLSASGLIEDGAIASDIPYTADRIFIKQIDYSQKTPGVPQPPSISRFSNTWLCSWLSGDNNGHSQWMDRYYNSAYYTLDQALSARSLVYNHKLDPSKDFSFDIPSNMYLEPGVLYRYFRVGPENSRKFLTYIDADKQQVKGSKILHISAWNANPLIDNSNFNNDGLVFFNKESNFQNSYMDFDGSNHVIFPSNTTLLEPTKLTTSLWIKTEDWSDINGGQIFGNYYESGFGLVNDSALICPLFTISDLDGGKYYDINYRSKVVSSNTIPSLSSSKNDIVIKLPDFNTWIFDSKNVIGRKFNPYGNLETTTTGIGDFLTGILQIEIDSFGNFYIFNINNDNTPKVCKVNSAGYIDNVYTLPKNTKRIEINKNNNIIPIYGNASAIDNSGNIWEMIGSNLYLNRKVYASVGFAQQMSCDSSNNIWILHSQDSLTKLNVKTGAFDFTVRVSERADLPVNPCLAVPTSQFRFLNFLKAPNLNYNACSTVDKNTSEDLIVIVDNRDLQVYILDTYGNLLSKLNLKYINPGSTNFQAKGDFSGYQFTRRFNYGSKNLSWKAKIAKPNGFNPQFLSLNYSVSSLPAGWHHFTFVFDSTQGKAQYYIDSIKVNESNFAPNTYQLYYDYRSSFILGAMSLKNSLLNDFIKIDDAYKFIGSISDLRLYNKALTPKEIENIYFSSPVTKNRKELRWNITVGNSNYIEEIQHWFQMQLPGNKSKYFNINIHNLDVSDEIKVLIENSIKNNIGKITPAQSSLYKINWI
jgi:hypothetical protein